MAEQEFKKTPQDITDIQELQQDKKKVYLLCEHHGYGGGLPPLHSTCKACWQVYYSIALSRVPPSKKDQRLEEWSQMVHHLAEMAERGMRPPQVTKSKEAMQ